MKRETTIRFMGDVMIGRLVNNKINESGYAYPWGDLLPVLQGEGVNIINLETTLTSSNKKVNKVFNFKAEPDKINTLKEGNIHIASLANNHMLDYSFEGLSETIETLDEAGIFHSGAGSNLDSAKEAVFINTGGLKIALMSCTDNEPGWSANLHPGIHYVETGDLEALKEDIATLKQQADLLILSYHWGPNMVQAPDRRTRDFAHQLIDLGVDIIHGHSAHIFQGIEIYKEKVIMYDCGDFIDDYMVEQDLRNDRSFLFECKLDGKKIKSLQLIPVTIKDMQVNLAKDADYKWAVARMQMLSEIYGTHISDEGIIKIS